MDRDRLVNQLLSDEGLKLKPYRCTANKLTIGVGRNLEDVGISQYEAMYLLGNDIRRVYAGLTERLPWFHALDDARQNVLLNMAFQMGITGLLEFKKTLGHVQRGEYVEAGNQMRESAWHRQTPARAERLIKAMKTGVLT